MIWNTFMLSRSSRVISALPGVLAILVFVGAVGWPLLSIQLRLLRNGAIASDLVELLHLRFPDAEFRGVASYDREVISIVVVSGLDPKDFPNVEQYVRD